MSEFILFFMSVVRAVVAKASGLKKSLLLSNMKYIWTYLNANGINLQQEVELKIKST